MAGQVVQYFPELSDAYLQEDGNYGAGASTDLFSELETQVKYGMTPTQALASATIDAATCIGYEDQIGTLEKGKSADMIAVHGDPTEDISILRLGDFVMREGCVLMSSAENSPAESRQPQTRP